MLNHFKDGSNIILHCTNIEQKSKHQEANLHEFNEFTDVSHVSQIFQVISLDFLGISPDFPTFSSVVPGPGLSPRPERRAAARRGEPRDAAGGAGAGGLPGGRGRRQGARGDVGSHGVS